MLSGDIPVIGVNDEIVDRERRPTRLLTMYFHTILKALLNKIDEAPEDGKKYVRQNGTWVEII